MRTRRISVKQTVTVSESLVAVLILVLIQFMGYMRSTRIDHRRRSCHIGWGRCFHFPARGRTPAPVGQSRRAGRGGSCLVETETAVDITSMWLSVATHRLYTP